MVTINSFITYIMLVFLVLGAIDFLLDNRFGIGKEFENGILSTGRLILCMMGFMALAPALAQSLLPVVIPLFRIFGADPSLVAGMVIANDSGGAVLAAEMASDLQTGQFSGLIVGSMMGVTVMFNIPLSMTFAKGDDRPAAVYGLLCGIITIPIGCIAGGFAAGFAPRMVLQNSIPVALISLLLILGLWKLGERIILFLVLFGKLITAISLFGLVLCALNEMTGIVLIEGMTPFRELLPIIGGIALFLAGAFPALAVFRRLCASPLAYASRRLQINSTSVTGLVMTLANALPSFNMLHDMDDKGRMMNVAWLVSASCIFGDHLAYTSQVAPELCGAMIIGKAVAGLLAVWLAAFLSARLYRKSLLK